jgi:hypothetical protein
LVVAPCLGFRNPEVIPLRLGAATDFSFSTFH